MYPFSGSLIPDLLFHRRCVSALFKLCSRSCSERSGEAHCKQRRSEFNQINTACSLFQHPPSGSTPPPASSPSLSVSVSIFLPFASLQMLKHTRTHTQSGLPALSLCSSALLVCVFFLLPLFLFLAVVPDLLNLLIPDQCWCTQRSGGSFRRANNPHYSALLETSSLLE